MDVRKAGSKILVRPHCCVRFRNMWVVMGCSHAGHSALWQMLLPRPSQSKSTPAVCKGWTRPVVRALWWLPFPENPYVKKQVINLFKLFPVKKIWIACHLSSLLALAFAFLVEQLSKLLVRNCWTFGCSVYCSLAGPRAMAPFYCLLSSFASNCWLYDFIVHLLLCTHCHAILRRSGAMR